jgi:hypothetical protein
MSRSATFTVTLRTHSEGAYRRLRRTLKTAWRRDQLQAIDAREILDRASPDDPASPAPAQRLAQTQET